MIIDVTGVILIPGNNGEHYDKYGVLIECCCDECDYAMCCLPNACTHCLRRKRCPAK